MILIHVILFLQLLPTIICFIPSGRNSAAAVLVNSTIWFFGGCVQNSDPTLGGPWVSSNSLFSLDVSRSWKTSSPPWTDHSSDLTNPSLVYTRCQSTLQLGADGVTLWVFGGQTGLKNENLTNRSPAVQYNTATHVWSSVIMPDNPVVVSLHGHSSARNSQGVIFYFGGQSDASTGYAGNMRNDDVIKLSTDPGMGNWSLPPRNNGQNGRYLSTATLV
ncbi:hypothetical protein BC936DRAFT_147004 [Jimgerdemannia flammicorona]|uniref:Galactose oxidase n=1 Tax=Jimgerdemannia flammicorona TaxID=994334 RepID=A0A433D6D9_9FUNG|nr:hypothetical protein BC936DRAFT_147004 [Jimgerdemannia flammicorona]